MDTRSSLERIAIRASIIRISPGVSSSGKGGNLRSVCASPGRSFRHEQEQVLQERKDETGLVFESKVLQLFTSVQNKHTSKILLISFPRTSFTSNQSINQSKLLFNNGVSSIQYDWSPREPYI